MIFDPSIFIHIAKAQEAANGSGNTGVAAMFGLNWKLFIAQLINFGIVLFVLWRWVFGPVTRGLTARTNKIEQSLAEAKRIEEDRGTFETWKQGQIANVRQEAADIITQAKQEAENLKQQTMEQTKTEQQRVVEQTQAQLVQQQQQALATVKGEIADLVVTATQTLIRQKLDSKIDRQLIAEAIKQAEVRA